ncbi:laminin G domain-containing protein [Longispora albida]|uniref:laminin G domain-containing protein n=1 Tax=Longispora albida TaxID=203523 RepID=UPI000374B363|nr:laminin G domain-containing protein [Longispora albida]
MRERRLYRTFAVTGASALLLTGVSASAAEDGGGPLARYNIDVARTTADGAAIAVPDSSGRGHDLWVKTSGGGELTVLRDGGRPRLRFPDPCDDQEEDCPHAILQGANAAELNPGSERLRYGATVRMTEDETSEGSNILQKGYSMQGSQYKLQVDGAEGKPSCVLVGHGPIWLVLSRAGIADGAWHTVECARDGRVLTISVDGRETGRIAVPSSLSIENNEPLRLGGKGTAPNNDQYFGELSEAFVAIG